MNLQVIKSTDGKAEYVLLPVKAYKTLKSQIDKVVSGEYENFNVNDYISNPVALMRIKANLTQKELAKKFGVSQAYISKLESQEKVSVKVLAKVKKLCKA